VLLLVVTEKLDKKSSEAPWVQSFAQHGVWVPVWPVGAAALPAWLAARAKRGGVEIEPGAVELIASASRAICSPLNRNSKS
jgi:DNA polymerase III delta subunit